MKDIRQSSKLESIDVYDFCAWNVHERLHHGDFGVDVVSFLQQTKHTEHWKQRQETSIKTASQSVLVV